MKQEYITPDVKQIFKQSDLKGKIVDRFVTDIQGRLLVFFADKTVAVFKFDSEENEEDGRAIYMSTMHYSFIVMDSPHSYKNALRIGTISRGQYEDFERTYEDKNKRTTEYMEREQLEKLKAKYPDEDSTYVKKQVKKHIELAASKFSGENPLNIAIRNEILTTKIKL